MSLTLKKLDIAALGSSVAKANFSNMSEFSLYFCVQFLQFGGVTAIGSH